MKFLITFILLFGLLLGACNGEQDTNGEETDETLEEAEAKRLMSQYRTHFEKVVEKRGEDQLLEEYATIEEIKVYFNKVMVEELAEWYADTYFEVRNGDIYIIPMDGPIWLKEDQPIELLKVEDHSYQLKQQLNSEWLGHVYYKVQFIFSDGNWKIADLGIEEIDKASVEEAKFLVRDYLDFLWSEDTIMEVIEEDDHYMIHVYEDLRLEEGEDQNLTRGMFYVNSDKSQISTKIEMNAEVEGFASDLVKILAERVIYALKQKDMKEVAAQVDEDKGLLFSPYLYIRNESLTFTPDEVEQFFEDQNEYLWGHFDGSGNAIEKTPEEYYERFIYVENFIEAEEVVFNEIVGRGNLQSNFKEIFDEVEFVEYYISGSDENEGMDWRGLYLVFDTSNKEKLKLIAIIHNQWTI